MLRNTLIAAALCLPAAASYAATGDPCVADTFAATCNVDGSIQLCDAQTDPNAPVEAALTCGDLFGAGGADGTCADPVGCVGACTDIGLGCQAAVGDLCIGFSPLFDAADPNDAGSLLCAGDATCQTTVVAGAIEDRCVAHLGPACAAGGEDASCDGTVLNICLGDTAGTFSLTSNISLDCAIAGATCGEQPCECDEHCAADGSIACVNGFCDSGIFCAFALDSVDGQGNPIFDACPAEGEGEGDEGEGEGEGDSGREGEGEGDSGGSACGAMTADGSPLAGLAVFGAALALRRRRR